MAKIGIFRDGIYETGGIETWLYNIAVMYGKTHDITIYYDNSDSKQIKRLQKLVKCVLYQGQDIEVDTAIWCYDFLGYDTTRAKRRIHIVHADYRHRYNFYRGDRFIPDMDEVYATSQAAADSAIKLFGVDIKVLYNLTTFNQKPRQLRILSATRLSQEKGLERMVKLDKALIKAGVDYRWDIYTPTYYGEDEEKTSPFSENVFFQKPVMSVLNKMKASDFVVQLSDSESFGYSIVEAMALNVPLVVTALPVLPELKINKHNAIIIPLRKYLVDYGKIVEQMIAKSPYTPPYSDCDKIFGEPKKDYHPVLLKNMADFDIQVDEERWLEPGEFGIFESYDKKIKVLKELK